MSSRKPKSTPARRAPARKSTEHPVTPAERAEASRALAAAGQRKAVMAAHFCEAKKGLPIAGTPAPQPCPFCGFVECAIVFEQHESGACSAHVECDHCGIEGPFMGGGLERERPDYYEMALEAARMWNTRKGVQR